MHENKKNIFFKVLTKTGYFNTAFVFLRYIKNESILIKMDRKICEKIIHVFENVFFFCKFLNGSNREQNWAGTDPNTTQTTLYWAGLSPAAWTGLMIQPELVTVPCTVTMIQPGLVTVPCKVTTQM